MTTKSPWHSDAELPPERGTQLDTLMDTVMAFGRKIFAEHGEVYCPVVFGEDADGKIAVIYMDNGSDPVSRDLASVHVRLQLRKHKATRYALCMEAWMGSPDDPRRPHEQPGRVEALVFSGEDRDGTKRFATVAIARDADGRGRLGEAEHGNAESGRWFGLLK